MTTNNSNTSLDRKPAYIAFKTFLTAIETLEQGLPPTIYKTVWSTFSGGLQSHTLGAFKFLGLVDENGKTLPILEQLVAAKGDNRKEIIRKIISDKYSDAIKLGQQNSSYQELL